MSTYKSDYTDEQIDGCFHKFYNSLNTVEVVSSHGATVVMTKDSKTLYAIEHNGKWVFYPDSYGVWTISGTLGQQSTTTTVDVDTIKLRTINLIFGNGNSK